MKGVQCYVLFGGIALKNHAFSIRVLLTSIMTHIYIYMYSSYDETIQRKQSAQYRKRRAITVKVTLTSARCVQQRAATTCRSKCNFNYVYIYIYIPTK